MTKMVHLEALQFSPPAQVALFIIFVLARPFLCALPGSLLFFPTVKLSGKLEEPVKLHAALQMSPHSSSQMSETEH